MKKSQKPSWERKPTEKELAAETRRYMTGATRRQRAIYRLMRRDGYTVMQTLSIAAFAV